MKKEILPFKIGSLLRMKKSYHVYELDRKSRTSHEVDDIFIFLGKSSTEGNDLLFSQRSLNKSEWMTEIYQDYFEEIL